MLKRLFLDHPDEVGETYLQHLHVAFGFGGCMLAASFACFVHGLVPGLHKRTGSRTIGALHERMISARVRPHDKPGRIPDFWDFGHGI